LEEDESGEAPTDGGFRQKWGIVTGIQRSAAEWAAHRKPLELSRLRFSASDPGRRKRMMFGLGPATKIYIAVHAIDMRKGFERLHGLVRDHFGAGFAEWPSVFVHQSDPDAMEGAGVGWKRVVGLRAAPGERQLPLATGGRRGECHDARRAVIDVGKWIGHRASQTT
jgi:hypothetical protein